MPIYMMQFIEIKNQIEHRISNPKIQMVGYVSNCFLGLLQAFCHDLGQLVCF